MKKIVFILLVAALVLALVACGGDAESSTPASSDNAPASSSVAPGSDETPDSSSEETPDDPGTPGDDPTVDPGVEPEDPPLYEEGENILDGNPDYMAINPFQFKGTVPCAFEDFHEAFEGNWALVIGMQECVESVYEDLFGTDPDVTEGPNWIVNNQYKWVLNINGTDWPVTKFDLLHSVNSGWVRMGLGEEFAPAEGLVEYDIKLLISDVDTNELVYWAWLTNPDLLGDPFTHYNPGADSSVPDPNVNLDEVEKFDSSYLTITSGPTGSAAENYPNLFDKDIRTKLCSGESTTPIYFVINDNVTSFNFKSISLVGANDDDAYTDRIVTHIKLYGSDTEGEGANWDLICDATAPSLGETPYQERNYDFTKDSTYRFYKLELVHEGTFQIGEIYLYAEKDSVIK